MRNYNAKSQTKKTSKEELFHCPVFSCNRKYKREDKRKQHVEQVHYFETRNKNNFKFDHELRAKIYDLAAVYLEQLQNNTAEPKNLLPQYYGKEIPNDDLQRITEAQSSFAKRLLSENLHCCNWKAVMDDFQSFFNMGLPYYDTNFCPTLVIDFLWHSLMQDPELYSQVCKQACKDIMPHCNIVRTEEEDVKRYEYFVEVFKNLFKSAPQSFSSDIYSKGDVNQIFIDLRDKELLSIKLEREEQKRKERFYLEMIERDRLKQQQREEEWQKFCEMAELPSDCYCFGRWKYYQEGYYKGLRGKNLENYAIDEYRKYNPPSTC